MASPHIFRSVHLLLLGVIGAAIVHLVVLFLLPLYSETDAWSRLSARADYLQTVIIGEGQARAFDDLDPLFRVAACRFDLSDGAIRVGAGNEAPYWSASVYDRWGRNVYSLNETIASNRMLDLVVGLPEQMIELRKRLSGLPDEAIFVEVSDPLGFVAVRAFRPDASYAQKVTRFVDGVECLQE